MYTYLIISKTLTTERLTNQVEQLFVIEPGVWAALSKHLTSSSLCHSLGMNKEERQFGIVVKFEEYYGWYTPDLWQTVEAWQNIR